MTVIQRSGTFLSVLLLCGAAAFADRRHAAGAMGSPTGSVAVKSSVAETLTLWLGPEEKIGELAPGAQATFDKVRGGTQRLRAHTVTLSGAWEAEMEVVQGGKLWEISDEATGGLRILNYTGEPLKLIVEKVPYLVVPAGAIGYVHYSGSPTTRMVSAESASGKLRYAPRLMTLEQSTVRDWKFGNAPKAGAP